MQLRKIGYKFTWKDLVMLPLCIPIIYLSWLINHQNINIDWFWQARNWWVVGLAFPWIMFTLMVDDYLNRVRPDRLTNIKARIKAKGRAWLLLPLLWAPFGEEIAFRLAINVTLVAASMIFLPAWTSLIVAFIASSILFGILHYDDDGWPKVILLTFSGMLLNTSMVLGGLPIAMVIHFLNNLVILTLYTRK